VAIHNNLIIDACVLINLLASGMIEQILRTASLESNICVIVRNESIFLRNEADITEIVPLDIQPYIDNELIKICDLETVEEQELFVNIAAKLDDGEAMSIAIAISRKWDIATDDKKARRIFLENVQKEQKLTSTSSLIKEWAEAENISEQEIKELLSKIETSARFHPARSDANYQWWVDNLR
jgi:predicted nucleic acid-binding protein